MRRRRSPTDLHSFRSFQLGKLSRRHAGHRSLGLNVVTAFHLKLYPKPAVCGMSLYAYPFDCAEEVFTWARDISADLHGP